MIADNGPESAEPSSMVESNTVPDCGAPPGLVEAFRREHILRQRLDQLDRDRQLLAAEIEAVDEEIRAIIQAGPIANE